MCAPVQGPTIHPPPPATGPGQWNGPPSSQVSVTLQACFLIYGYTWLTQPGQASALCFSGLHLSFICVQLQGFNPVYPHQNPAYPPTGPAVIAPAQPPQWNGSSPGQYPAGSVAQMV